MLKSRPGTGCSPYASENALSASPYLPASYACCPARNCSRARVSAASPAAADTAHKLLTSTAAPSRTGSCLIGKRVDETISADPFGLGRGFAPRAGAFDRRHLYVHIGLVCRMND